MGLKLRWRKVKVSIFLTGQIPSETFAYALYQRQWPCEPELLT
jgi:hypothetical protein